MASRTQFASACALLVSGALLTGCSTAPKGPQPGTPAFYWGAAREAWRAGDFVKASEHLSQITRSDNEFTTRARVWEIILSAGLAQAYMELADAYETGARVNRKNPAPFRREMNVFRTQAGAAALQFADAFHRLQHALKDEPLALEFAFPAGTADHAAELKKITSGILIPEAELAQISKAMARHEVLMSTCRAVGAPGDPAKASQLFEAGSPQVGAPVFRVRMASQLYDAAQMFEPKKLDNPQRQSMLLKEALEATQSAPPAKETKALMGKIRAQIEKNKPR